MMTGASDPVTFSVKIKTETYGTAKIVKTSEDGIVSGISFNIKGSGVDQTVKTDNSGTISHKPPSRYLYRNRAALRPICSAKAPDRHH